MNTTAAPWDHAANCAAVPACYAEAMGFKPRQWASIQEVPTVDDAMVERAARALYLQEIAWSSKAEWDRLPDPVKKMWHLKAGAVLDAALNPRERA